MNGPVNESSRCKGVVMTWLDEHLETFVRPYLGEVPNVDKQHVWVKTFSPKLLAGMLAIWNRTKVLAKGRTILLPGRDVYLFEVIARMQGDYPTIFRPDISSSVAPYVVEDYKETFVLDTGYKGSVPKAMGIPNWVLIRYDFGGRPVDLVKQYQVFPTIKRGAMMSLSSFLEGCPKYWDRANMAPNQGYKGDR